MCRMYNKMTMEVILSTAFGRAVDVQNGKGGRILESAVRIVGAFATEGEHASKTAGLLNFISSELGYNCTCSMWHFTCTYVYKCITSVRW